MQRPAQWLEPVDRNSRIPLLEYPCFFAFQYEFCQLVLVLMVEIDEVQELCQPVSGCLPLVTDCRNTPLPPTAPETGGPEIDGLGILRIKSNAIIDCSMILLGKE